MQRRNIVMGVNSNHARENFLAKYKENIYEIEKSNKILQFNDYLRTEDRIPKEELNKVIEEMTKSMERQKRRKRANERKRQIRNGKRVKASKTKRDVMESENVRKTQMKNSKETKYKGNVKKKVVAFLLAGVTIAGGYNVAKNVYNEYQQQNSPITLEQALEKGETLEILGINNNIVSEIQEIKTMLERDDLTNEEMIRLAPRISALQFDTAKTKLANTLGVSENDIKLYTRHAEEGQTRETVETSNNIYTNKDIFTYENTIPTEISNYIKEIASMQDTMQQLQEGNIDRKEILKKYNDKIENTSKFAATVIKVDEKGNISVKQTKVADLDKSSNQLKKSTLDQEDIELE